MKSRDLLNTFSFISGFVLITISLMKLIGIESDWNYFILNRHQSFFKSINRQQL